MFLRPPAISAQAKIAPRTTRFRYERMGGNCEQVVSSAADVEWARGSWKEVAGQRP